MPPAPMPPVVVGEVVLTALDALLNAAALHLGEALPDGRQLSAPDPQEAWHALLAAQGLMSHVGPLMKETARRPWADRLQALGARLAERHPDVDFPVPAALTGA